MSASPPSHPHRKAHTQAALNDGLLARELGKGRARLTNSLRCHCGNELNPNGLEYAGFSVYEDGVDLSQRNPSRTWACRYVLAYRISHGLKDERPVPDYRTRSFQASV